MKLVFMVWIGSKILVSVVSGELMVVMVMIWVLYLCVMVMLLIIFGMWLVMENMIIILFGLSVVVIICCSIEL